MINLLREMEKGETAWNEIAPV